MFMLNLFNTLTRRTEPFVPIEPGQVRLYVCGMTVYDRCHLGHGRMLVNFDVLYRWLRTTGYAVTYVRNITDIDDKIIERAAQNGEPIQALTERMILAMQEDLARLRVLPPTHEPRATEHVPGMIRLIEVLIQKGLAYSGQNGDVYYSVRDFPDYGKLSGKSLEDLRAGERVARDEFKRDPLDFVLWKSAKPGEPRWPSPWGEGRPGWHIECSVMSECFLGAHFDIHGGGHDLQFPHHENEIAQSEGAHGHAFVNVWMHNGFLRVNDEKMSKSLGNFFTLADIFEKFHPEVVRFFLLRGHYRSPLNYTDGHLEDARQGLNTLYTVLRDYPTVMGSVPDWNGVAEGAFKRALDDDLNTPEAVAVLFGLAHDAHRGEVGAAQRLRALAEVLGLLGSAPVEWFQRGAGLTVQAGDEDQERIEILMAQRQAARARKDFSTADQIRQALLAEGIVLEDKEGTTQWRRS
ncbi:MAG: cysteine--tRNA ligase [Ferrovum myxofaciens]|uniref:Cysteine--tRNA ligase n=4 Tax=root TaxID=1 RepID=A0A9E6MYM0_9PROT|nr:MAG: cysteine--tRNA ligase [Ferrovum myxofaciens]QWY76115.1 MAG: cysteine--tRNA ligase [Ferrovum myxofaciens]QWY78778.1 MAG: cysteine--tRNA ligase [Ferrovum myxofaciens]